MRKHGAQLTKRFAFRAIVLLLIFIEFQSPSSSDLLALWMGKLRNSVAGVLPKEGWRTCWGLPLAESAQGCLQDLLSKLTWHCHATSHLWGQKAEGSPCLLLTHSQALESQSKGAALSRTLQFSFSQNSPGRAPWRKTCLAHLMFYGRVYMSACACLNEIYVCVYLQGQLSLKHNRHSARAHDNVQFLLKSEEKAELLGKKKKSFNM